MNEFKIKMPGFFDPEYSIITMPRGKKRKASHRQIVIEFLRALENQKPTRDQLQKIVKIQRKRFIEVLKVLLESGDIARVGTGTKSDPYLYCLTDRNREPKRVNHFW